MGRTQKERKDDVVETLTICGFDTKKYVKRLAKTLLPDGSVDFL